MLKPNNATTVTSFRQLAEAYATLSTFPPEYITVGISVPAHQISLLCDLLQQANSPIRHLDLAITYDVSNSPQLTYGEAITIAYETLKRTLAADTKIKSLVLTCQVPAAHIDRNHLTEFNEFDISFLKTNRTLLFLSIKAEYVYTKFFDACLAQLKDNTTLISFRPEMSNPYANFEPSTHSAMITTAQLRFSKQITGLIAPRVEAALNKVKDCLSSPAQDLNIYAEQLWLCSQIIHENEYKLVGHVTPDETDAKQQQQAGNLKSTLQSIVNFAKGKQLLLELGSSEKSAALVPKLRQAAKLLKIKNFNEELQLLEQRVSFSDIEEELLDSIAQALLYTLNAALISFYRCYYLEYPYVTLAYAQHFEERLPTVPSVDQALAWKKNSIRAALYYLLAGATEELRISCQRLLQHTTLLSSNSQKEGAQLLSWEELACKAQKQFYDAARRNADEERAIYAFVRILTELTGTGPLFYKDVPKTTSSYLKLCSIAANLLHLNALPLYTEVVSEQTLLNHLRKLAYTVNEEEQAKAPEGHKAAPRGVCQNQQNEFILFLQNLDWNKLSRASRKYIKAIFYAREAAFSADDPRQAWAFYASAITELQQTGLETSLPYYATVPRYIVLSALEALKQCRSAVQSEELPDWANNLLKLGMQPNKIALWSTASPDVVQQSNAFQAFKQDFNKLFAPKKPASPLFIPLSANKLRLEASVRLEVSLTGSTPVSVAPVSQTSTPSPANNSVAATQPGVEQPSTLSTVDRMFNSVFLSAQAPKSAPATDDGHALRPPQKAPSQ